MVVKAVADKVKKCGANCHIIALTARNIYTDRDAALQWFKHIILTECSKFTIPDYMVSSYILYVSRYASNGIPFSKISLMAGDLQSSSITDKIASGLLPTAAKL